MATNKNNQSLVQQNMKKIKTSAKYINKQVVSTVEELIEDTKTNSKEARKLASSSVKEVQFKNSLGKVLAASKKVNKRVKKTTTEVMGDVVNTTKKSIQSIDIAENIEQMKANSIKVNDFAISTTENIINAAVKNGTQFQNITDKAVKGGLNLAERQQDIVFTTLNTVKGQILQSTDRLRSIFNYN